MAQYWKKVAVFLKKEIMKMQVFVLSIFLSVSLFAQDDVYFRPEKKPRPLKDRKMYTTIAERQPTAGSSLYFSAGPVNQYSEAKNSGSDIYYYIFLQGAKQSENQGSESVPMNISFVIDRSGSMSGKKLEDVKKAVEYACGLMQSRDYISVVQYDDAVQTIIEPVYAENKARLKSRISEITSGGSTNLC